MNAIKCSDTHLTFFPESLDLRIAADRPSGRAGGGCNSGFVFNIFVTDGVNGGGMLGTAPAGSPEPRAPTSLSSPSPAPSSAFRTAFLPFFVSLDFAGVFFFSGDTVIGCSSEWRERYHRQSPLCTPRSPETKNLVGDPKRFCWMSRDCLPTGRIFGRRSENMANMSTVK